MTDTRAADLAGFADLPAFADLLAGDQIAGRRKYQEDDFRIEAFPEGDPDNCDLLLVLADGMGGHRGGAQASRLAVSTFVDKFRLASGGAAARLRTSLDASNAAVGRYAEEHPQYAGMGCTLVACVVTDDSAAHWISVGDSLLWRLHGTDGEGVERLNADHSLRPVLEDLVRLGHMTEEEVEGGAAHRRFRAPGCRAGRRQSVTGQHHGRRLPALGRGGRATTVRAPHGAHTADRSGELKRCRTVWSGREGGRRAARCEFVGDVYAIASVRPKCG